MRLRLSLALLTVAVVAAPSADAAPGEPVATDRDCLRTLRGIDLQTATIPDLDRALAAGTITSVDLVDAYQARMTAYASANAIRQFNPAARATAAALDAERAAGHVRGPMHGIPVLLKDNVGTDDLPTTAGSVALEGQIPRRDATITAKLRAAGAIVLGKTNLSEWANWMATGMPNGYSSLGGQVNNAYDGGDPSGSSSGSGVAASLALAAATIGTETSGSILSPSLVNSDVGLKTTRGIVSRLGIVPLAEGFDVPGPIVRHVADAAAMLGAIVGADPEDPATSGAAAGIPAGRDYLAALGPDALRGVRLAYSTDDSSGLSDAESAIWMRTLARLRELGAVLVPSDGFGNADTAGSVLELPAIYSQFHAGLDHYLATEQRPGARVTSLADVIVAGAQQPDKTKYGQDKLVASEAAPGVNAVGDMQAQLAIDQAHTAIDATLNAANALAFIAPDGAHIGIGAAGGHPQVVLPLGYPGGDRFGISLLGRRYADGALLAAASALETRTGADRVPPTQVEGGIAPASCDAATRAPFVTPAAGAAPGTAATSATPAAPPAPGPTGTTGPAGAAGKGAGGSPTVRVRLRVVRPAFSARRTLGGHVVRVGVRIPAGAAIRGLTVRVVPRGGGPTILTGRSRGTARGRVRVTLRLVRKEALRPGRVRVVVRGRDAAGRVVTARRTALVTR